MSTQLKLRRGTTAQHAGFTGADGEITVDTSKKTLVVHDGATAGGTPLVNWQSGPLGNRNRLINGNFRINQRGAASASTAYAAGAYVMDRWKAGAAGCTLSFATSGADVVVTITAGSLIQVVEDKNIEGGVYALQNSGTAQARIGVNGAAASGAYAAATAAAPLLSASATANQTVSVEFSTGTLSKVQLELGSVASPFERRPMALETLLCQRYFWKAAEWWLNGYSDLSTCFHMIKFPVTMRAAPTYASASADSNTNVSSSSISGLTADMAYLATTPSAVGFYRIRYVNPTFTSEL